MKKQKSMSQKVRDLIDRGHTNKTIIDRLGVKPQVVYNMRYQMNKERGLGAIGKPAPKPTEGIGTPPKRAYTRKVPAGTGINKPDAYALPVTKVQHADAPEQNVPTPGSLMYFQPPSWWQRLVSMFKIKTARA